jgi:transcriptional regulator with XRE-family HTH domain
MKTIFEQIGEKINQWLVDRGQTQSFFADRMGISKQVMSKIVNGKKAVNVEEVRKIAAIMGISVDELLGSSQEPPILNDPVMFMVGKTDNENTKEKLQFLNHVMNEMIELEDLLRS